VVLEAEAACRLDSAVQRCPVRIHRPRVDARRPERRRAAVHVIRPAASSHVGGRPVIVHAERTC